MIDLQNFATLKKVSGLILVSSALAALSGCSAHKGLANPSVYPTTQTAIQIVSQESQRALAAQKMLLKYREQYNDTLDYRQRNFETDKAMIDYIGKPQSLLSSIAIRYGYRYLSYGVERELPTVNFTQYYSTPENMIVNLNAQIGDSATISVDKQDKVITLIYP